MSSKAIKTILLIEDNPGDARLLIEMIKDQGLHDAALTHVETMREAETHLVRGPVDIVLLDVGLPDARGLEAVRRAKAAAPRIPLVVLTGLDDEALASQALQEGAQDYLIKGEIDGRGLRRALRYAIEREIMEEALFVEKERAEVTLNCIGDAVACTDLSGNLTFLNLVAQDMTGWSHQEATGRPMAAVFQIVDAVSRRAIPTPAVEIGRDRTAHLPLDAILVRRDNWEIPIEDSVAPIHDREGRTTGAVIVLRDVSAARAMARQMTDSASDLAKQNSLLSRVNGELTALVRSSPIAIYSTDPAGIVTMWSPAAERLSGFTREEAVGSFLPIVPDGAVEDVKDRIRRVSHGEATTNAALAARKKDGAIIELSISMGPLTDDAGVARGAICLAENMTEAVSERRKIERMQSEFVSTVSHELRTPLTSIGGSLGLIAGGAAGILNERAARLIEIANNNTQRLIRLVNDILDIEKFQSGRMAFHFAPVRIDDVIDQAIAANLAYAATFGVELRRLGEEIGTLVRADVDRVNQAITNLISNAVKFSPPGAQVEICATRAAGGVRISVEDHGDGISQEFRSRIFERFAQADSSDIRQKGGSGLGLSIVRQIMESHGGAVSFDSDLGAGTRFYLDFPTIIESDSQSERLRSAEPPGRVLVFGRDAAIADPIRAALLARGFDCASAATEEHALQRAAEGVLTAAILDIPFADESLGDFLGALRRDHGAGSLPIFLLCAPPAARSHFYVSQAQPIVAWISRLAEINHIPRGRNHLAKPFRTDRISILHVDRDRRRLDALRASLRGAFTIVGAATLEIGRRSLAGERFDLVILDFSTSVDLAAQVFPTAADAIGDANPIVLLTLPRKIANAAPGGATTTALHDETAMIAAAVRSAFASNERPIEEIGEERHATQSALR